MQIFEIFATIGLEDNGFTKGVSNAASSMSALKTKQSELVEKMKSMEAGLKTISGSVASAKSKYDESVSALTKYKQAMDNASKSLNDNKSKLSESKNGIEAQRQALSQNQKAVSDAKIKYDALRGALGANSDATKAAKIEYDNARQAVNENRKAIEYLKVEYADINARVKESKQAFQAAKSEYNENANASNRLKGELRSLEAEYERNVKSLNDTQKALQDVEKEMRSNTWDDFKGKLSAIGAAGKVVATTMAAASTAFAGLTLKSLQLVGDLEQSVGGIETLFKDSSDAVIENAERAYITAGVNANDYMQQVTSFSASLLQSLGGDTEKAAAAADMAIIDMSDNANKMGTAIESIQNAYQGFAKQNYTMLDNLKLGYGGTKTEMERLLADAEKISGIKYDMSSLDDVYQAIHVIQTELDITGTTAKEAMETLSGSAQAAKAAFSNFLSGAGGVEDVISTVSNFGDIVVKNLQEILPRLTEGLPKLFAELVPVTVKLFDTLLPAVVDGALVLVKGLVKGIVDNLPLIFETAKKIIATLIEGIGDAVPIFKPILDALSFLNDNLNAVIGAFVTFKSAMAIGTVIGAATNAIKLMTTAQWWLNAAMNANPIGLVATALSALVGSLILAYNKLEWFRDGVNRIWNSIKRIFGAGEKTIDDSTKNMAKSLSENLSTADLEPEKFRQNIQDQLEKPAISAGTYVGEQAGSSIGKSTVEKVKEKLSEIEQLFKSLGLDFDKAKSDINKFGEAIEDALTAQYESNRDTLQGFLDDEIEAIRNSTDEKIKEYDREYNERLKLLDAETYAAIQALQDEIDGIDALTKKEEEARKEREEQDKIEKKRNELYAAETYEEQQKLQGELNDLLEKQERNRVLKSRDMEKQRLKDSIAAIKQETQDKKDEWELQREDFIEARKQELEDAEDHYKKASESLQNHYKEMLKAENIQAQARKLAVDKNNKEVIALLNTYNQKWYNKGNDFMTNLINGMNDKMEGLRTVINNIASLMSQISTSTSFVPAGSYATGLSYVPYDDFPAYLHRGETVLTAEQAENYRNGNTGEVIVNQYFYGVREEQTAFQASRAVRLAAEREFS